MLQDQVLAQKENRYESWLAVLDAYGVQFLAVDTRRDSGLLQAARSHPAWTVDFEDRESVLFTRVRMPDPAQAAA